MNDDMLAAAARELRARTKIDTVNAALTFVAHRRRRIEALADPLVWGGPDLANPEVRAAARR